MSEKNTATRLTRETVLRGALALLNDIGIDALSTRRLAQHLGVQSPTLYWHFKNKAELLKAMAETIMLDHREEVPADMPWQDWVCHQCRQLPSGAAGLPRRRASACRHPAAGAAIRRH
ncbi:TetR family transcriptional regulator [Serratia sp. IR-2025]